MEKIQKRIADSGFTSRRKAEELVKEGRVLVNGSKATIGMRVKKDDIILIDNNPLVDEPKETYFLNKPRGYVSTTSDDKGRKSVVDLIDTPYNIYPVGRLDYNTTGAMFLTNDGELAELLSHPSHNVEKEYIAKLNKVFLVKDLHALKQGVVIDGIVVKVKKCKLERKDYSKNSSYVSIVITEGRQHIIKRVFQKLGYDVEKLTRIRYENYTIDKLQSKNYIRLTKKEAAELKARIQSS